MTEEMFDPEKMQSIVDRLKAEGRMPTPEKLHAAMAESRAKYQVEVRKMRADARRKARAKKSSKSTS